MAYISLYIYISMTLIDNKATTNSVTNCNKLLIIIDLTNLFHVDEYPLHPPQTQGLTIQNPKFVLKIMEESR